MTKIITHATMLGLLLLTGQYWNKQNLDVRLLRWLAQDSHLHKGEYQGYTVANKLQLPCIDSGAYMIINDSLELRSRFNSSN